MKGLFVIITALLLAAGMPMAGAQQSAALAEKLIAGAQHKAAIDGDLKGAIEDYRKAVAAAGSNRALMAQALLRMAECHQKLGDAEAQAIYERVARDYADQKDAAAAARTRLAGAASAARVTRDWSVWTGEDADGFGTISSDGRVFTYTDWKNGGALALRYVATGAEHRLTSGGSTEFSAISKDGRQVAYQWRSDLAPADVRRYELRVARLHATTISDSRRLHDNEDVLGTAPYDWSPDGKRIAVGVSRKGGTRQIALVDVADGSLHVLKSLDWKEPTKIFFSPDGKQIAYDLMVSDSSDERHIFVMAADGSREAIVVAHPSQNVIMGWSPDGQLVLFASDRSGSFALWGVPVVEGKATGPATLVKADIAASWSLGLTAAGTMFVWKYASPVYVQASGIDLKTGKLTSNGAKFQRFIGSRGRPEWSADGQRLAFQSCSPLGSGPCKLWVQSMDTGQLREVNLKLGYFFFPRWSPDGRELLVRGVDLRGRNNGLYRIDVESGNTTLVVAPFPGQSMPQWMPDGEHAYYRRGASVLQRNLASGAEREVVRIQAARAGEIAISPDGGSLAYYATEPTGSQTLSVMPVTGGDARVLFEVKPPLRLLFRFEWTGDGRALVIATHHDDTAEQVLWLIPADGGPPRKLDIDISKWSVLDGFRIDRGGQQIAFVASAGNPGLEIRAFENFLPAPRVKNGRND